ncbi:hypothetical protein Q7P36_010568 [Cladosporium allicinum]
MPAGMFVLLSSNGHWTTSAWLRVRVGDRLINVDSIIFHAVLSQALKQMPSQPAFRVLTHFTTTRNASLTLTTFIAIVDSDAQHYQRVQQHSEPSHVIVDRHSVGRTRRIYTTIERSDKILFIRNSVKTERDFTFRAEIQFAPSFLPSPRLHT